MLSKYAKYTSSIKHNYENVLEKINTIETQLMVAQQNINNIKNNKNNDLVYYNNITADLLNIKSEIKMLNDNMVISDANSNEIVKIDNIINFNKDVKTDNYLLNTVHDSSLIEKIVLDKFNDEFNKIRITPNPNNQNLLSINIDAVDNDIKDTNIKYLTKKRVYLAKDLLSKDSDLSILDISGMLGFENPSTFSKHFKQEFNLTPKEYRNNQ